MELTELQIYRRFVLRLLLAILCRLNSQWGNCLPENGKLYKEVNEYLGIE